MEEWEKDLDILILRQQLAILQRKQEKPVKLKIQYQTCQQPNDKFTPPH